MNLSLVRKYIKNVNWSVSNCSGWRIWYQYSRLQGFYLMCFSLMLLEFTFILVLVSLYYLFEKHVLNLPSILIDFCPPHPTGQRKLLCPMSALLVSLLLWHALIYRVHLVSCCSLMFAVCVYLYICLIVHNSGNIYSSCLPGLVWSAGLHVACIALNAYFDLWTDMGLERGIRLEGMTEARISQALEELVKVGASLKAWPVDAFRSLDSNQRKWYYWKLFHKVVVWPLILQPCLILVWWPLLWMLFFKTYRYCCATIPIIYMHALQLNSLNSLVMNLFGLTFDYLFMNIYSR